MKKFILAMIAVFGFSGAAAAQDALEGIWQTQVDDGAYALVTIAPCGEAFCGVISRTFNAEGEYESPNKGRQIVIDMVAMGDGHYEGQVWRPSNDKIYIGKMDIEGNQVRLRGCIAGGLLCSSQTWVKIQ